MAACKREPPLHCATRAVCSAQHFRHRMPPQAYLLRTALYFATLVHGLLYLTVLRIQEQ